jgi:dTDP-4-dehydrorhamnose reductase
MRVLVFGSQGQVGHCLQHGQWPVGVTVVSAPRAAADLTRLETVDAAITQAMPDVIINAAAYTAVDKAESDRDVAFAVNATAVGHMAARCAAIGIPMLHISTDYVFDGSGTRPYAETDPVNPMGVYGASKAAGEDALRAQLPAHVILRTSWVYGVHGNNFIKTMQRLGRERDTLSVVADQHGAPTSALDIADALIRIVADIHRDGVSGMASTWGTYHFAGAGETTWHGFADHIFADMQRRSGRRPDCHAITTAAYPTPARRPANSRLDCSKFDHNFDFKRRPWQESVDQVLDALPA